MFAGDFFFYFYVSRRQLICLKKNTGFITFAIANKKVYIYE